MKTIGGLFGRSPFGPLREHMLKVVDCIALLTPLVKAWFGENFDDLKRIAKEISKEEHAADDIKKRIRDHLSKSVFTSVNRADILTMLKEQDSIADACEETALLLAVRKTGIPEKLDQPLQKTTDQVTQVVRLVSDASELLNGLEEEAAAPAVQKIYDHIEEIQKKEWETDQLQQAFLEQLFFHESKMNPLDVFFLMTVIKLIGKISDHADNVGECMRRILAR